MKHKKKQSKKLNYFKGITVFSFVIFIFFLLITETTDADQLYNTTNLTNANNIYEQAVALNEILGGNILGLGIQLIVIVITFTIVSGNTGEVLAGTGAAGFIGALSATMLLPLRLISFQVYEISLLIAGVSVALSLLLRR